MNNFLKIQDARSGREPGKIAMWEPSVLLSHSLFSTFSPKGRTSDGEVPLSKVGRWPEGDPGVDAEKGAEEDAEVRKADNRSGSCRPGWTPEFSMKCASTTEFDASPLALLALGDRGRGEKGKLAMSFDSSGEASLVIATTKNRCTIFH